MDASRHIEGHRRTNRIIAPIALAVTLLLAKAGIDLYNQSNRDTSGSVPNQPTEALYAQNPWADEARKKILGQLPLEGEERIVEAQRVISHGEPGTEGGVNARDGYPSNFRAGSLTEPFQAVDILGTISYGTEIRRGLVVTGTFNGTESEWIAFRAGDILRGGIIGQDGNPVELNPNRVITMDMSYVASIEPQAAPRPTR